MICESSPGWNSESFDDSSEDPNIGNSLSHWLYKYFIMHGNSELHSSLPWLQLNSNDLKIAQPLLNSDCRGHLGLFKFSRRGCVAEEGF